MEIFVASKHLLADVAVMLDVAGREHLVIVTKASWRIPAAGQRPQPIPPLPLVQTDLYAGEPGESAMLYGTDFARFKPRCDVLFNASVHSPTGKPATQMTAGWRIGALQKGLKVFGPRHWNKTLGVISLSKPAPFVTLPLHFGLAYGGTRTYEKGSGNSKQMLAEALLTNPSGIGWAGKNTMDQISGQPAPSLEALDDPIQHPNGKHTPAAFSAVGRHWTPRKDFAGTYDDKWQADVFPFLPEDFDEQFNQCAPRDQQMAYPRGGEEVVLVNLLAGRPDVRFILPRLDHMKVRILRKDYSTEEPKPVVDTLYFEPDEERFSVIWRTSVPVKRRIQEFDTLAIGPVSAQWWQQKSLGAEGCVGCGNPAEKREAFA